MTNKLTLRAGLALAAAVILAVLLFGKETAAQWVEAVFRFVTTGGI